MINAEEFAKVATESRYSNGSVVDDDNHDSSKDIDS